MRPAALWFRVGGLATVLVALFLVISGVLRLADGDGGAVGPVLRLVVGVVLGATALAVAALGQEGRKRRVDIGARGDRTVTCSVCTTENPPSAKACVSCETPLR